ncbi:ankyrin repeat domain-containing protein [Synechocystis sp. LKSZ1]|uniref:ankyrin repeat domain-containing protein n=1 Tax=Synechocystis sp. LKSZ1 TaxID=3144951 RepID=UPI00336BB523
MAQQPDWITLYERLAQGQSPDDALVQACLNSRNGLGETMLHWYAIEGESFVLERIVSLGFDVNTQNIFGNTPIMEAALIGRWDNVKVLQNHGARLDICNQEGQDYWAYLEEFGIVVPEGIFS